MVHHESAQYSDNNIGTLTTLTWDTCSSVSRTVCCCAGRWLIFCTTQLINSSIWCFILMLHCWHSRNYLTFYPRCLCSFFMCHTPEQNNKTSSDGTKISSFLGVMSRSPNSSPLDLVESITSWMNSLVTAQNRLCGALHICVIGSLNNVSRLQWPEGEGNKTWENDSFHFL